ncbi:spore coat protein YlbD [Sporolactobacillus vineae]|uniref:spore coat protein YlbD n=1 Tax=Sporolactobacillus vineae TaxID=444463 RepID=UPI00038073AF|nr:spore coat protein YlbD [Sporolactobacillus vineae]
MAEEKTNDALNRFKKFLRRNPEIVDYVREHHLSWSHLFDEWVIFGEDDPVWEKYGAKVAKKEEKDAPASSLSWKKIVDKVDHIDTGRWQERLNTVNGALTGIRSLISQFSQNGSGQNGGAPQQNNGGGQNDAAQAPGTGTGPGNSPDTQRPYYF